MILVDTSIWIDHLKRGDLGLIQLLNASQVLVHRFVIGELALGNLRQRDIVLGSLQGLPQAVMATDDEVVSFIGRHALFGSGMGYIDAHLLAAVKLSASALLWTRDKRLRAAAARLGLSVSYT